MAVVMIGLLGKANPKLGADALKRLIDRRRMANVKPLVVPGRLTLPMPEAFARHTRS